MSEYKPDKWIIIKITAIEDNSVHYRVFATWYGGYGGSDSWKLNSGITEAIMENNFYIFYGESGSKYFCHKDSYGLSAYGKSVLSNLIEDSKSYITIELLEQQCDWLSMKYD